MKLGIFRYQILYLLGEFGEGTVLIEKCESTWTFHLWISLYTRGKRFILRNWNLTSCFCSVCFVFKGTCLLFLSIRIDAYPRAVFLKSEARALIGKVSLYRERTLKNESFQCFFWNWNMYWKCWEKSYREGRRLVKSELLRQLQCGQWEFSSMGETLGNGARFSE